MENKQKSAFPLDGDNTGHPDTLGLTKREYFAAMAMQGWISCQQPGFSGENEDIARRSIECADELLKQLDAGGEKI